MKENLLTVTGRKAANDEASRYLHRGLAERNFERRFQLADYVVVTDANLADGLLSIALKRELPEALKPRTVQITTGAAHPDRRRKGARKRSRASTRLRRAALLEAPPFYFRPRSGSRP